MIVLLAHSAGTAAAIFARNRTLGKAIQEVDSQVLTAALLEEGQVLHPPQPAPLGWACELGRCVGVDVYAPGNRSLHNDASCGGQCSALAPSEWLANAGFWREVGTLLVAKQATVLKKSVTQSGSLAPKLLKAVPEGFHCKLEVDGKFDGYWLCSA